MGPNNLSMAMIKTKNPTLLPIATIFYQFNCGHQKICVTSKHFSDFFLDALAGKRSAFYFCAASLSKYSILFVQIKYHSNTNKQLAKKLFKTYLKRLVLP
jgi:hypothetical protein